MVVEVKIPEVGESINEGVLVEWLQADGTVVSVEDPLLVLETDKITMNVNAEHAGRLKIIAAIEETVEVGQVVATIDTDVAPISETTAPAPQPSVTAEEEGMRGKPHPDVYLRCAEILDLDPSRSFVVEDAASGVEAGSRGKFGVVVGLAHGGQEQALRDAGADIVISDPAALTVAAMDSWFAERK